MTTVDGRRSQQSQQSRSLSRTTGGFYTGNSMTNNNRTYVNKGTSYKGPSWEKAGLSFMQRLAKNEPSEDSSSDDNTTVHAMLKETTKMLNIVQHTGELAEEAFTKEYEYAHSEKRWHKDFENMDEDERIEFFKSQYRMKPEQIRELTFHPKTNAPKNIHKTYTGIDAAAGEMTPDSARIISGSRPNSHIGNVYKRVTVTPTHQRKDFMLSRLQGNIYHHITNVYGSSPRNKQEKTFYEKLSQIQLDELKSKYKMLEHNERKRVESWFRQKEQLEQLRKKYEKDAWRRFMTQYVTSKVVQSEVSDRKEYGLPNSLDKDPCTRKKIMDDIDLSMKEKTNKKKFGYMFSTGPDFKIKREPMKFEGTDSVFIDTKGKNGKHVSHRLIVAHVIKEARMLISQTEKETPRNTKQKAKSDKHPSRHVQDTKNRLERPRHHLSRGRRPTETNYMPYRRSERLNETPKAPKTITDMIMKRQSQPINRKRTNNPVKQTMSKSVLSQSHVPVPRNRVPLRPISLASIHTNNLPQLPSVNKIKDAVPSSKSRVDSVQNHNETKTYSEFSNNQNIPKRAPSVVCIMSKADRTVKQNAKNEIKVTNTVKDKDIVNGGTKVPAKTLTNRSVSRSSLHKVNSNYQNDLRPNSNKRASKTSVNMSDYVDKSVNGRKDVVNKDDQSNDEISSARNVRISDSNVTDTEQGEHTQKAHVVEIISPNNDPTYVDEIINREDFEIRHRVQTHGKPERNGSPRLTQVRSNLRESKGSMPKKGKDRLPTTKELKEKTLAHKLEKSRFPDINVNDRTIENASASPKPEIKRSVKYDEVKTETARTVSPSENQGTSKWKDMVQKYLREPYLEVGKNKRLSVFQTEMDTDDSDSETDIFERARKKYGLDVEDDSDDNDE